MIKRILLALTVTAPIAVMLLFMAAPRIIAQDVQCSGSFTPSFNCVISGLWDYTSTAVTAYPVPFKAYGAEVTGITSVVKDLTNAEVLALNTTPVTIIPAPGSGKFIDVIGASLEFNYTGAYSSVANLRLFYSTRLTGAAASAVITGSGFLDATADTIIRVGGVPDNTNPPTTNLPVVIQQVTYAAMAGGNAANSLRVVVNYRIVNTGF